MKQPKFPFVYIFQGKAPGPLRASLTTYVAGNEHRIASSDFSVEEFEELIEEMFLSLSLGLLWKDPA